MITVGIVDYNSGNLKSVQHSFETVIKNKNLKAQTCLLSEAQHLNQPDEVILKTLVSDHLKYTNSEVAKHILDNWDDMLNHFVKVMPNEYRRALNELQEKTNKETV